MIREWKHESSLKFRMTHVAAVYLISYFAAGDSLRSDTPICGTPLKLLSMLLQVTLYTMELIWGGRAKPSLVIDKDELCVLKMHDHIWSMIAIDIHKAECHRY